SKHVLKGWAQLSKTAESVRPSKENAVAVENLLKRLVDEAKEGNSYANPTTVDYNCMLESWARSGEGEFAAERCEQILIQMQQQYELDGDGLVRPDLASFKAALMAWKHAGGDSLSSFRAQRILEWMLSLYISGKNDKSFPDVACFDTVLQSWSRNNHKQAPMYAENLLSTMEKLDDQGGTPFNIRPRTLSYNAVLQALCNKGTANSRAWQRTCNILEKMENHNDIEPDRVSYHIVLGALARSGDPRAAPQAEKILKRIERNYKGKQLSWKPETFLFNSVMGCWAHSNKRGAYRKSRSILDRQLNLFADGCKSSRPDVYGFTSVLSACASESGSDTDKAKAFNVAISTFQELVRHREEFGKPNHVTYGTMLKCVAQLLPRGSSERKKWTKKYFQQSTADGMVGSMVLARVREAASTSEEYKQLMMGHSKANLPKSWTRNVHENSQHRRKVLVGRRGEV
ncbi:MAG: hypothetical protein SGILL_000949, partial [Bacillariaceae sp.]